MSGLLTRSILTLVASVASVCSSASASPPAPPPITIEIGRPGATSCELKVDGEAVSSDARLEALERRLMRADRTRGVRLLARGDAPYRCVGGVIFTVQRLNFTTPIALVPSPPPAIDVPEPG